ncbi:MAG: clostripain-related cysteine peptidase [Planctomycetota bacterium]
MSLRSILLATSLMAAPAFADEADWTILFYAAGDNSAEESLMPDLADLGEGFRPGRGVEILVLVDRSPKFSTRPSVFGGDFEDTRLYRMTGGPAERLSGGDELPEITKTSTFEANMGDAKTLQRFIGYGKKHFPAKRYALIFYSHGNGCRWCPDNSHDDDSLYPGELSEVLTKDDSVDLMAFDVCSMGGIEVAYQFRPGNGGFQTDAIVASGSATFPWTYAGLVARLFPETVKDGEKAFPETALKLGNAIVEVLEVDRRQGELQGERIKQMIAQESWACLDLSHANAVKTAVDALARQLGESGERDRIEAIRGSGKPAMLNYLTREEGAWLREPYFDLFDLGDRIAKDESLSKRTRQLGQRLSETVDLMVKSSFGLSYYDGFQDGKHGIYIVFPDGGAMTNATKHWTRFGWYSPLDCRDQNRSFGNYAWCRDDAEAGNGRIENWFELLDAWFDSDEAGGSNGYSR